MCVHIHVRVNQVVSSPAVRSHSLARKETHHSSSSVVIVSTQRLSDGFPDDIVFTPTSDTVVTVHTHCAQVSFHLHAQR